jgi:hypothetical protein
VLLQKTQALDAPSTIQSQHAAEDEEKSPDMSVLSPRQGFLALGSRFGSPRRIPASRSHLCASPGPT